MIAIIFVSVFDNVVRIFKKLPQICRINLHRHKSYRIALNIFCRSFPNFSALPFYCCSLQAWHKWTTFRMCTKYAVCCWFLFLRFHAHQAILNWICRILFVLCERPYCQSLDICNDYVILVRKPIRIINKSKKFSGIQSFLNICEPNTVHSSSLAE